MASILLIDDSQFQLKIVTKILQDLGYKITALTNGNEGLNLINNENYDCIITDLLMPEIDGFQILEKLQEQQNQIPVIVLSADIQESSKEKAFSLGAKAFLNKPTNKIALERTLNRLLN